MRVTFQRKVDLRNGVWEYYFVPERPLDYIPGQYVDVRLPHANPDNRGMSRTFTLTSLPSDPCIRFVVKFATPPSTYKKILTALEPGDEASITDAMGDVVLPKSSNVPLTFVAGGLGIASFVSIMRWLSMQHEQRDITLLYAVRDTNDLLFQEVFDTYPFPVALRIFTPETQRLNAETIMKNTRADGLVYISGSEGFVEGMRQDLQATYHLPNEQIVYDFFDGYRDDQL